MASKLFCLKLLFILIRITFQNPVDSVLSPNAIETLLQSLSSQTQTNTNAHHQRNSPQNFHHAAHTKQLESTQIQPQPLQQPTEDNECKTPGRCGCSGNRCDDDQQSETRQGDGKSLEALLKSLAQVSNSKEGLVRCSKHTCNNNNRDRYKTNDRDKDQNGETTDQGNWTSDKIDKSVKRLIKQLEQNLKTSQQDGKRENKQNVVDDDEKYGSSCDHNYIRDQIIKSILFRLEQELDDNKNNRLKSNSGFKPNELAKLYEIIKSKIHKGYSSKKKNRCKQKNYNLRELDTIDALKAPNIKRDYNKLFSNYYTETQLVNFYNKYMEKMIKDITIFLMAPPALKYSVYNLSQQQKKLFEDWKFWEGKEDVKQAEEVWRAKVREVLFGLDSDIRVYPNRDSRDLDIHVPVPIYRNMKMYTETLTRKRPQTQKTQGKIPLHKKGQLKKKRWGKKRGYNLKPTKRKA